MRLPSLCSLLVLIGTTWALPALHTSPTPSIHIRSPSQGLPLNVLCVGDSITVGIGDHVSESITPDGLNNGYRLDLYNRLNASDIEAQFIGSQTSGTADNPEPHHEGYGGQVIQIIFDNIVSNHILEQQTPNLVLLHAGTNDNDIDVEHAAQGQAPAEAPTRLANLLDYILCYAPNAVVLVAELIYNRYRPEQTQYFNDAIPGIVDERLKRGFNVRVVHMESIGEDLLSDLLHPTAAGYDIMAGLWFDAIMGVPDEWWDSSRRHRPCQHRFVR